VTIVSVDGWERISVFQLVPSSFMIWNLRTKQKKYIKTDKIAQGSIAINTIRWITQDDFNKSKEIIKNSILLNRNNRIYIDLKGKNIKLEIFLIKNLWYIKIHMKILIFYGKKD